MSKHFQSKYIKIIHFEHGSMNTILHASSRSLTVRLLAVNGGHSDKTLEIPLDFLSLACRTRWLDCAGQPATPSDDVSKLGIIQMPVMKKRNCQFYVSFEELKAWYELQDLKEKIRIDDILAAFDNTFTFDNSSSKPF